MEQAPHKQSGEPDNTAIRTALWRALHARVDSPPIIIHDDIGLKLIAPEERWQQRPDMDPDFTRRIRASIVARARFVDDLVTESSTIDFDQYVILGAGLDSFAQRLCPASSGRCFPVADLRNRPARYASLETAATDELGFGIPDWPHIVRADFETASWWERLLAAGFDVSKRALVTCTGVSLYLTREAIMSTLRQVSAMASGSLLAMSFYLPIELLDEEDRFLQEIAAEGARKAGTPFVTFVSPDELLAWGEEAGLEVSKIMSTQDMVELYFAERTDGFYPASGELFLIARS